MSEKKFGLYGYLLKARMAIIDGRHDEGVEELRQAIFGSLKLSPGEAKRNVEAILKFSNEHDVFDEVDSILGDGPLRDKFYGE